MTAQPIDNRNLAWLDAVDLAAYIACQHGWINGPVYGPLIARCIDAAAQRLQTLHAADTYDGPAFADACERVVADAFGVNGSIA